MYDPYHSYSGSLENSEVKKGEKLDSSPSTEDKMSSDVKTTQDEESMAKRDLTIRQQSQQNMPGDNSKQFPLGVYLATDRCYGFHSIYKVSPLTALASMKLKLVFKLSM